MVSPMQTSSHVPGFLASRGYAPASLRQRASILRAFVAAIDDSPPDRIDAATAFAWWGSISHLSAPSRQAHLSTVRQFMRHLIALELIDVDPTRHIDRPRNVARPPVTLTVQQVIILLASIDRLRDRAAAALMLGCGLRASDVTAVLIEDVSLTDRVLRVRGKGGKTRLVPMPTAAVECVADYLADYPAESGFLIRCVHGGRMDTHHFRVRMTKYLYAAGIKQGPHDGRSSHVLRRTCATMLLESGASIRAVQTVMGHESIATTQHYLALPEMRELVKVIDGGPLAVLVG